MKREVFDVLVAETVKRTAEILVAKGAEYANDDDRLANFKRNAARNGHTVLEEWMTYWNKHIDSIHSYMARVRSLALEKAMQDLAIECYNVIKKSQDDNAKTGETVTFDLKPILNEASLRERINVYLPAAMREIDATLSEPIEGRFDDNINYSILCQALLAEIKGA